MKEKIKLTFVRLLDNSLPKIPYFQKNFLRPMAILDYIEKLKRGLGLALGALDEIKNIFHSL